MNSKPNIPQNFTDLRSQLDNLLEKLPDLANGDLIAQSLEAIAQMQESNLERLDWKLISGSLKDMQKALKVLHPCRHIRKVSIFGSARTPEHEPVYQQAKQFAEAIAHLGFMVFTGAGGGIMAAANAGAGLEASFGLNINLPFEQTSNAFIESDRLVSFKYFFTRKLFFLKESDAVAIFPGGFGTQDELYECLTLCQTGKATPRPIILIDLPGGDYWQEWSAYIDNHLLARNLISAGDRRLYQITDDIQFASSYIQNFYSVYHSSRWIDDLFVIRLNFDISDLHLTKLNNLFENVLTQGTICRSKALAQEQKDPHLLALPRLIMHFDRHEYDKLQELIEAINDVNLGSAETICHPQVHPEKR